MPNRTARDRALAPAIGVGIVLVALFASTATLGRPADLPNTGAPAWLPPDGTRQRFSGPNGTIALEWAVDRAAPIIGSGPLAFSLWLSRTDVDWATASAARVSSVLSSPSGVVLAREDDLFTISADGLRAEVEAPVPGTIRIYVPGRLDVPADLAVGRTWTSEGQAVEYIDGEERTSPYRADFTALKAGPIPVARGCVAVAMRLQVGATAQSSEQTWCRHAGTVGFRSDTAEWRPDAPAPPVRASPPDPGLDWSTASSLRFRPLAINRIGAPGNSLVSPLSPPGVLPDGGLVFDNRTTSQDVLSFRIVGGVPMAFWRGRPGGRITASALLGGVTLAAGANRRLVAYGTTGQWLWEQRLGDLAVVPPVRLGELAVVATLDGRVTAYDLATGHPRWSFTASAEIRVALVAAGDRVLVADQAGRLTCLGPDGSEQWATDTGRVERFTVWTPPGGAPAVIVPQAGGTHVQALSLADGTRLWRVRELATAKDLVALDHAVVLRDDDEVVALDPMTGAVRWRRPDPRTFAAAGGASSLLLLARDRLLLLDDAGRTVTEWPVDVGDVSSSAPYLVAAQGRVLVYGPGGVAVGAVP